MAIEKSREEYVIDYPSNIFSKVLGALELMLLLAMVVEVIAVICLQRDGVSQRKDEDSEIENSVIRADSSQHAQLNKVEIQSSFHENESASRPDNVVKTSHAIDKDGDEADDLTNMTPD